MEGFAPEQTARDTREQKAALCAGSAVQTAAEGLLPAAPPERYAGGTSGSGPAVRWPSGCAVAASFDRAVAYAVGQAVGAQARAAGALLVRGPLLNIKRSPLSGSGPETFSEDPCLTGALAAAWVEGLQSSGAGACVGRFAVQNQETGRGALNVVLSERTLRELYLPAFETVVRQARPRAVLCAGGRINGVPICEDHALLTGLLRESWGFAGLAVSEPFPGRDPVRSLRAGADLLLPGEDASAEDAARLSAAVRDGSLDESVLDRAGGRVLDVLSRAGCPAQGSGVPVQPHARAVALAKECAVLVKNRGALPLRAGQKVVYIGGFAERPRCGGFGAAEVAGTRGRDVHIVQGFPADRDQREETEFLRAVEAAAAADAAVVFAGLPESTDRAGTDRRHMHLPDCQNNLIARVAAVQKNTVVVLHTGAPVECPWAGDVAAVLCMYRGGEGVGPAADALLWGDANPSGRLPETWPLRLEDTPAFLDYPGDGKTALCREGVFVGYRWYDARRMPVLWPFGHGLSYTGFVYKDARLSTDTMTGDGAVTVSVTIKNSGAMAGRETVQMYVTDETGCPVPEGRPPRELKGFVKVSLAPGAEQTVTFPLTVRDLSWYSPARGGWYAAPGRYTVQLGHSSRDLRVTLPLRLEPPAGETEGYGGPQSKAT